MPPMPTPIVTLAADRTDPSVVEYLTKPFLDVQQANPSLPLTPPALKAWSQEHGFDLAGSMNVNDTQGRPWAVGLGRFNTPKTQQQIEALGMLRMDYNMSLHDNAKRSLDKHNIARQI